MTHINVVSFSFSKGGAAIAAKKFTELIPETISVNVLTQDSAGKIQFLKRIISWGLGLLQYNKNKTKHSLNLFSHDLVLLAIKEKKDEIFHFHWINNDTLSVFDFDKIPINSLISLHDEWLYCGSEHCYDINDHCLGFVEGYNFFSSGSFGFGWRYIIWRIKLSKLKSRKDIIYTVPSTWMLSRAKSSLILKNSRVFLLPNPIDVDIFSPMSSAHCFRTELEICDDEFVICFGAIDGKKNPLKGGEILDSALEIVSQKVNNDNIKVRLVIFGQEGESSTIHNLNVSYCGYIREQEKLASLFCVSDCVIVPSIVESFGQVAAEAMACGVPVIAFKTSGLTDIVIDGVNGFLAEPFSIQSLAEKIIAMIYLSPFEKQALSSQARLHIENNFSYEVISKKYLDLISLSEAV